MDVRPATREDLPQLTELRNWYVEHSFALFEETPFSAEAMDAWFAQFRGGPHRLLVAEERGTVLGYCSSQSYRAHPAFARTIETSVYVSPTRGRGGVGSALYAALFAGIADEGMHRAVVGIGLPNDASVRLHEKFGFRSIGVFDEYAIKHGRFISSRWMEKMLP